LRRIRCRQLTTVASEAILLAGIQDLSNALVSELQAQ
jgi:hypothetical protein